MKILLYKKELIPFDDFSNIFKYSDLKNIWIIVQLLPLSGKCFLMIYLLNKKFADLLLTNFFSVSNFFYSLIKSIYERKSTFGKKILRNHLLFKVQIIRSSWSLC